MFKLFKNNRGSAMVQVMVVSAAVLGLSAFMLSQQGDQEKLRRSTFIKANKNAFIREISEALSEEAACFNTLQAAGTLSNDLTLPQVRSSSNNLMYQVGSKLGFEEITSLRLRSYAPSSGMRYNAAQIHVGLTNTAAAKSFGSKDLILNIPLFLITNNNQVSLCVADPTGAVKEAYKSACEDLEGSFNEDQGVCANLHGNNGAIIKRIRSYLCTTSPGNCVHPYAGKVCTGTDLRGQAWNNWVITGFGPSASLNCACIPAACPNRTLYCAGTDLGTNHCALNCPVGTMDCSCNWATGPWGACNSGTQSRTVSAVKNDGTPADPANCTTPQPPTVQPCTPPATYAWSIGSFGSCSNACGSGTQARSVVCQNESDGSTVADTNCPAPKPATSQGCTGTSCGFAWKIDDWDACSESVCGNTGTQARTVVCQDGGTLATVSDSNCTVPKPAVSQSCSSACGYEWRTDSWGSCAPQCSPGNSGTETRNVFCYNTTNNTNEPDASKCTDAKPSESRACTSLVDTSYAWNTTDWGSCNFNCSVGNSGTQERTVTCQGSCTSNTVADSNCSAPKPASSQSCTGSCSYSWFASGFEACNNTCGSGTQNQTVTCRDGSSATVDDGLCTLASKPASTQNCTGTSCANCPTDASKSWSVGANSCSGSLAAANHAQPSTAQDTSGTERGQATYTCNNGNWEGPTGASCAFQGCNIGHPIVWTGGGGANTYRCAEYFNAVGSPLTYTNVSEGHTETANSGYCGTNAPCNGTLTWKCQGGSMVIISQSCVGGNNQ